MWQMLTYINISYIVAHLWQIKIQWLIQLYYANVAIRVGLYFLFHMPVQVILLSDTGTMVTHNLRRFYREANESDLSTSHNLL